MADVSGSSVHSIDPDSRSSFTSGGMFGPLARSQYSSVLRMRWRMFRNGLRSINGILDLGAIGIAWLLYSVLGLGLALGLGFAAYALVSEGKVAYLPILFWAICLLWQVIPIMLASFQQQTDLNFLLRFPLGFGAYYLMYLLLGLLDVSTILGALCCLGVWIGIGVARPGMLTWAALELVVLALFNILLVRAIFAWIERWLAQRKTREILGAVFMICVLSVQLLNPALYRHQHAPSQRGRDDAQQFREMKERYGPWLQKTNAVQAWLPPGLEAVSFEDVEQQQLVPGLSALGLVGMYALFVGGVLAIRLGAEYRGENLGTAPKRVKTAQRSVPSASLAAPSQANYATASGTGRSLPSFISGPVAAVIGKEARALMRTLPLLYAIGAPLLLVIVFSTIFVRNGGSQAHVFPLALPICMVYAQLGFTSVFYNNLGAEGAGIQLYFMSPTPIRTVLFAKNLFHAMLFAITAMVAAILASLRVGIPDDPAILAATATWLLFALPCNLAAGNIVSIKMPYRVNPGRIGRSAGSQGNSLFSLVIQLGFLAVGAAVFALSWSLQKMWLAAPVFLVLAVAAVFVWLRVLDNADTLANQSKVELMETVMKTA